MIIAINRREILDNLIRFKEHLSSLREEPYRKQQGSLRVYKALLNRQTGDFHFAENISNLETRISNHRMQKGNLEDWKPIRIHVEQGEPGIHFEVKDSKDFPLNPKELEPLAWRIAGETIEVLNKIGGNLPHITGTVLPEEYALQDLSCIHVTQDSGEIENLPGWSGSISRIEAEHLLADRPVGTFLLRNGDEITICVTLALEEENHIVLQSYVLTVVEEQLKISDYLIVYTNKGWTFYSDDPDLTDCKYIFYPTALVLLNSISRVAKAPFFKTS
jgi:hypothetical protein